MIFYFTGTGNSLYAAKQLEQELYSIAFCCISTGVFMFPNEAAAEIAVKAVRDYLAQDDRIEKVIFNVYKDIDLLIYQNILQ